MTKGDGLSPKRRVVLAGVVVILVAASLGALAIYAGGPPKSPKAQQILIIASVTGFNDSADHGVPASAWPIVHVSKGTTVNFTVFNDDKQAHGFQVSHYLDSPIETIAPGQRVSFSFVANETGTFRIYCSIFCTVHWAMQSGELIVA